MTQMEKNCLSMQDTQLPSLGWEDPLQKGIATHSNTLAYEIPWTGNPGRVQSLGLQRVEHNLMTFIFILKWSEVKLLSCVLLFATLWTVAHQTPLFMGFSRLEYWSGSPSPSPGDLPDPGIEPRSPALQADALTSEPPGKPHFYFTIWQFLFFFKLSPLSFYLHIMLLKDCFQSKLWATWQNCLTKTA